MPDSELVWARFGDAYAVHHKRSGLTHLVDSLMVALLRDGLREPCTVEEAAVHMAKVHGGTVDDASLSAFADVVGRLEALGLVRRELIA